MADQENDRLHISTLRIGRNIQRLRLERACVSANRILYERIEQEMRSKQPTEPAPAAAPEQTAPAPAPAHAPDAPSAPHSSALAPAQ